MNSTLLSHPSAEELRQFGSGAMSADETLGIESHVGHCPECCQTLRGLASDTFIDLLRSAVASVPVAIATSGATTPLLSLSASGLEQQSTPVGSRLDGTFSGMTQATADVPELPAALRDHPRYRVLKLLGWGGMGAVYLAEHRLMARTVALKIIKSDLTARPEMVERFRREVKAAASLSHPNIVQAFDAEQAGDTHFLVMEFVPGAHLGCLIDEQNPLPCAEV